MTNSRTKIQRTPLQAGLLAVPVLLLLGACGLGAAHDSTSGNPPGTTSEKSPPQRAGDATARSEVADGGATTSEPGKASPAASAPMSRAVVATGQVSLQASSLLHARAEALRLTTSWDGQVADEQTSADDKGRIVESTMTLRVPTPRFSEAMTTLATLGRVEQTSRSTEDVTTQVIDNEARIRAAERSIAQIERLLSRAQQLADIITIESDLARRQADLDSLKRQQAWLDDQTSLSTINLHLARLTAGRHGTRPATGFLAGLGDGWHALQRSTVAVLQVVGAVLPFGVLLAVLGVPLVWWGRRHRQVGVRSAAGEA